MSINRAVLFLLCAICATSAVSYTITCNIKQPLSVSLKCNINDAHPKEEAKLTKLGISYRLICNANDGHKLIIQKKKKIWEKAFKADKKDMVDEVIPGEEFGGARVDCYNDKRTCEFGKSLCY